MREVAARRFDASLPGIVPANRYCTSCSCIAEQALRDVSLKPAKQNTILQSTNAQPIIKQSTQAQARITSKPELRILPCTFMSPNIRPVGCDHACNLAMFMQESAKLPMNVRIISFVACRSFLGCEHVDSAIISLLPFSGQKDARASCPGHRASLA